MCWGFFPFLGHMFLSTYFLMNTKPSCFLDMHLVMVKMSQLKKDKDTVRECTRRKFKT